MGKRHIILGLGLGLSLAGGCMADDGSSDDLEFRQGGPGYLGNGDIDVADGEDVDLPDAIIWDVSGGSVARQLEPGVFVEQLTVTDDEIMSAASGSVVCSLEAVDHSSGDVWRLVDEQGSTVLTAWDRYVFAGDVALPSKPDVRHAAALQEQVVASFYDQDIYMGTWWDGPPVASASEAVDRSAPMRRLLLASLVNGECGSGGLP